jgi:uncharacterized membrane protein YoaK (UPF0700 family)
MDWSKWFAKVLIGFVTGATAGVSNIAMNPNVDVSSQEGIATTSMTGLIVAGLTALGNYLKHRND